MRGTQKQQGAFFSYVSLEDRVPATHPLRAIRQEADRVLKSLSGRFAAMYSETGRPSIPPEQLLRALLLQALYSIRSERMLMEQLEYNLLFRWFVGLEIDDRVWVPTVFTKNRDRLLEAEVAHAFLTGVVTLARKERLLSDEHFTVDGTLIEAWASVKSFVAKEGGPSDPPDDPGNPTVNFHGEERTNETHQSTTDPEARLYRKGPGKEAKLSYMGHALMENRHGFVLAGTLTTATGKAEEEAAMALVRKLPARRRKRSTVGADKGYDRRRCVEALRRLGVRPHVAAKVRGSALDGRTTRHVGYQISQRKRKLIEQIFGWVKTTALLRRTRHRGLERVGWVFEFTLAAYNLLHLVNLLRIQT
jgi:transposase